MKKLEKIIKKRRDLEKSLETLYKKWEDEEKSEIRKKLWDQIKNKEKILASGQLEKKIDTLEKEKDVLGKNEKDFKRFIILSIVSIFLVLYAFFDNSSHPKRHYKVDFSASNVQSKKVIYEETIDISYFFREDKKFYGEDFGLGFCKEGCSLNDSYVKQIISKEVCSPLFNEHVYPLLNNYNDRRNIKYECKIY